MGVEPQAIKEALSLLDYTDDAHWTTDGLPRMDVVESIVDDKSIVRADVTNADPEFTREVAQQRAEPVIAEAQEPEAPEAEDEEPAIPGAETPEDETEAEAEAEAEDEEPEAQEPEVETSEQAEAPEQPEERLTVQEMILKLDRDIAELDVERNALTGEIRKLQIQRDTLQVKAFSHNTTDADMKARQEFIRSQNELRAAKFARSRNIMQLIGKENLDPRCKLDRAMARKTARGTKRPRLRKPRR